MSGPVVGPFVALALGPFDVPGAQTDLVQAAVQAPCDLRIERVFFRTRVISAVDAFTIAFHPTAPQYSGSVFLMTQGIAEIYASGFSSTTTMALAPVGEPIPNVTFNSFTLPSVTSNAGYRNVPKGGYLFPVFTTDATGISDVVCVFLCTMTGFMNVDRAND